MKDENKIDCPNCGRQILDGITYCPHCGAKQQRPLNKNEIGKDPYEILQVAEEAEPEVIQAAYRSLARKYHPDHSKLSESEERMREINWAYEVLSDPEKLSEWKRRNRKRQSRTSASSSAATPKSGPTPASGYYVRPAGGRSGPRLALRIIAGVVVLAGIVLVFSELSSTTRLPTPTPTKRGTEMTHLGRILATSEALATIAATQPFGSDCIPWTAVTYSDVGNTICVYGGVVKIYTSGDYVQIIRFGNDSGTFEIWSHYNYPGFSIGECVALRGVVQSDSSSLFMEIDTPTPINIEFGCPGQ